MDPNSGKKNMFNKLSKQQCIENLQNETFPRITLSFYRYVILENVDLLRDILYNQWSELGVLGRIYIAKEGINAQLSVPSKDFEKFISKLNSHTDFINMPIKIAVEDNGNSFFKLTIKVRKQIVADGLSIEDYDVTNVGKHLTAHEWNQSINKGAIVVDMRNHYESEIGRFKNAICPDVETFREELPLVKDLLNGKEDEEILLYCTGGIRCEKTSAYLKHHGFNNVNQLHGGIIDYVRQVNNDITLENKFEGKNFVFDERRSEKISENIISNCHQCGEKCDTHVNCINENCNLLFIQCNKCQKKYKNCCSNTCISISNLSPQKRKMLRKGVENKKMYYSHKRVNLNLNN